jgi:DNA-binding NtrC family response regulator
MADGATEKRPLVLIVEDELLIRWHAEIALRQAGFAVLCAASADEALVLLESRTDIGVVFSDVAMPGSHDGAALVVLIRTRWPPIGIVLTSGHDRYLPSSLTERARFLSKPYRDADLVEAIESVAA